MFQDWQDERLTWNDNVSTLTEIVLDGKAIWKPEFAVINGLISFSGSRMWWLPASHVQYIVLLSQFNTY